MWSLGFVMSACGYSQRIDNLQTLSALPHISDIGTLAFCIRDTLSGWNRVESARAPPSTRIDIHVGNRVKLQRTLLRMRQTTLGDAVGVSFQQIQKYERGANRIGASRLFEFSQALDMPVSFFFDEMPEEIDCGSDAGQSLQVNGGLSPGGLFEGCRM